MTNVLMLNAPKPLPREWKRKLVASSRAITASVLMNDWKRYERELDRNRELIKRAYDEYGDSVKDFFAHW